jgi:hypothetical protein
LGQKYIDNRTNTKNKVIKTIGVIGTNKTRMVVGTIHMIVGTKT